MSGSNDQQPPPQQQPDLNAAIQALIQQQLRVASGQGSQVQLPSAQPPPSQYSNDPSQGPDLLGRIGLALGGGALPGAPAELRAQMGRQALLNFGIGLMGAGRFSTPGEVLAGGLRGAQAGLLGSEATQAAQQEYALNAQAKLAELGLAQQKNRTEALQAVVPLLQMQGRLGLPPLFGPGAGGSGLGAGPPGGGPGGGPGDGTYESVINTHEGSGKDPNSSAVGGFLSGTWNNFAAANPDLFKGMSPEQILAARSDGNLRAQATTWLAQQNAKTLQSQGVTPTGQSLGIAHYLGGGAAASVMGAPDTDRVSKYVSDAAVKANPELATMTVGQLKARYAGVPNPGFLTASAQPPAAAPASPVGPYKVAGTTVAPPSAPPPSSALPVPPVPPSGAVPTIATPEDAKATARATGQAQPVPGTPALWATPEGNVTGTPPRTIEPGVQVAGPGAPPAAPQPAPPVGPITPPAAAQPPPAAPAQPAAAQPPPAVPLPTDASQRAPVRDLSQIKPTDMTEQEWKRYYQHDPTPEELTQRGLVIPGNEAEAQAAARGVQEAETAAAAAQRAANLAMQPGYNQSFGTVADLMKQNNAAQADAQKAREKYADVLQDTTKTNAAALQNYYTEQDTANAASYKAQVTDVKAAAVAAQNEIEKARIQAGLNVEQKGAEAGLAESQQTLSDMAKNATEARAAGNQLRLMPGIVDQLPQPGFAAQLAKDHPALIPWLTQAGALSPQQADATQVMRGLVGYMSVGLRPTGSGALRNAEMDRFQAVLPDLMQSANGRQDSLSLLQTLQDRIVQEHDFASKYFRRIDPNTGKPAYNLDGLADAIDAPKSQGGLGPIAPTGPQPVTMDANGQPQRMSPSQVQDWVHNNVGEGHAYWGWQPAGDGTYKPKLMVRRDHG